MGILLIGGYGQIQDSYYKQMSQGKSQAKEFGEIGKNAESAKDAGFYAYYKKNGQEFSISKADTYSTDNPMYTIKGIDKEGNSFEQNINPKKVDPENASFTEFSALSAWLSESGAYDSFQTNYMECPTGNILDKTNYLHMARNWRDEQMDIGNIVGYNNAGKACNALTHFVIDQSGSTDTAVDLNGTSTNKLSSEGFGVNNEITPEAWKRIFEERE
jgi:hypothetical protein